MKKFVGIIAISAGLIVSTAVTAPAVALPISVSQDGAVVTVSYDIVGQTVSFDYLFSMGAAGAFIGTTMDSLSIQFGGNNDALVASLSGTSINSGNILGEWTGYRDKQSGQGCFAGTFDAACYTRENTGVGGSLEETVIAANTNYLFQFDVTFKPAINVASVLAGDHSIKFLSLSNHCTRGPTPPSCGWKTGVQLSQEGAFYRNPEPDPDPDPKPVPAPGTLLLLALGLVALSRSGKRRTIY